MTLVSIVFFLRCDFFVCVVSYFFCLRCDFFVCVVKFLFALWLFCLRCEVFVCFVTFLFALWGFCLRWAFWATVLYSLYLESTYVILYLGSYIGTLNYVYTLPGVWRRRHVRIVSDCFGWFVELWENCFCCAATGNRKEDVIGCCNNVELCWRFPWLCKTNDCCIGCRSRCCWWLNCCWGLGPSNTKEIVLWIVLCI